jgi:hypothetical protein
LLPCIPCLGKVILRRIELFALEREDSELVLRGGNRCIHRSIDALLDFERILQQALRLRFLLIESERLRKSRHVRRGLRVVGSIPFFGDGKRTAIVGF